MKTNLLRLAGRWPDTFGVTGCLVAGMLAATSASGQEVIRSGVLQRDISLVQSWGRAEPSFIGGGRCGGGGTPEGVWNFLIGPEYSSPDFIKQENLFLEQDGKPIQLPVASHRLQGSGILVGQAVRAGLTLELYEFAPWDTHEVVRLIGIRNDSRRPVQIEAVAEIIPEGKAEVAGDLLAITQPVGTPSFGGGANNWAERLCRIGFNQPQKAEPMSRGEAKSAFRLRSRSVAIKPGESATIALIHSIHFTDQAPPAFGPFTAVESLRSELAAWRQWVAAGKYPPATEPRVQLLAESILVGMRMQQNHDGGVIAGVRKYSAAYMRDMHGAAKGFLAAGHFPEVAAMIRWHHQKFKSFGTIVDASEMGTSGSSIAAGNHTAELPAYFVLLVRAYVRAGGEPALLDEVRDAIEWCANVQITEGRKNGWHLGFNGDETERYVPTVDGKTYSDDYGSDSYGGGPGWPKLKWSFPSQVLAITSLDFAAECATRWGQSPDSCLAARDAFTGELLATFVDPTTGSAAWCTYEDGSRPKFPLTNYLLFPAWLAAPVEPRLVVKWVDDAAQCLKPSGILPVAPGGVEGFCGHTLALLLAGLKQTDHHGGNVGRIARVQKAVFESTLLGHFGLVNEFYGPAGTPNPHNLRPFESGILLEALLRKAP
jgi:hypothetical protein